MSQPRPTKQLSQRALLAGLALISGSCALGIVVISLWPAPNANAMRSAKRTRGVVRRCTPARPCLALLIDDIGRDLGALDRLIALPRELSFSVLPHAAHTAASVARLRRAGREYLIHMPMLPWRRDRITDEPIVLAPGTDLRASIAEFIARVPGAVGANNHMGSAFSEDLRAASFVVQAVHRRGLFFVDSRTSRRSRFFQAARERQIPCVARDVFLDDPVDPATILQRLKAVSRLAHRRGWAVAIGHPLEPTMEVLKSFFASRPRETVVPVSFVIGSLTADRS